MYMYSIIMYACGGEGCWYRNLDYCMCTMYMYMYCLYMCGRVHLGCMCVLNLVSSVGGFDHVLFHVS